MSKTSRRGFMAAVACVIAIPRKAIDAFTENRRKALASLMGFDAKITTDRANRNGDIFADDGLGGFPVPKMFEDQIVHSQILWGRNHTMPIGKISKEELDRARSLCNQGVFPALALRPKMTDEERDELTRQIQEYYAGRRPEPPPIVIEGAMDMQPIRPVEMDFA